MPLTPADVHNVAFSKPPIGKRGYNEDEVDAFKEVFKVPEEEMKNVARIFNQARQAGLDHLAPHAG